MIRRGWSILNPALGAVLVILNVVTYLRVNPPAPAPDFNRPDREVRHSPDPAHPFNNSLGFRGDEFESVKPTGVLRIVVLGDSSTYYIHAGGYVEELSHRFEGTRCEFVNAAVTGFDAIDMYVRYERDVLKLNPDIVIAALPNAHFVRRRPGIGVELLRVSIEQMQRLARTSEHEFRLMYLPLRLGDADLWYADPYWGSGDIEAEKAYVANLKQVMAQGDTSLIDASAVDWSSDLFYDQFHFNAAGHQQLAEWLAETVFDELCSN